MSWEELTLPFDETESAAPAPVGAVICDLSTQCGHCGGAMRPEHAHYRCTQCGQRDSCCDGPY
ncbi:MAG TPA: hypothetical protein VMW08_06295 [Acidimicrobiales bacterium]|nr:hypothetical protein [Acidimicrobiales bacterium]